jgi:tetratricopeptide (TPR) repeat protein
LSQLLASLAGFLNDRAKYTQAIEIAQQAAELARTLNDPATEALANLEWGQALRRQDAYYTARQHIKIALSLAQANGLTWLEAKPAYAGQCGPIQRDFREALGCRSGPSAIHPERRPARQGAVLNNLGIHYFLSGNAKAQEYYQTALDIFWETGDRQGRKPCTQ